MIGLVKDGNYYKARFIVTRRRMEQSASGEYPLDEATLLELGYDLQCIGDRLREMYPVKSQTANSVRVKEYVSRRRGVTP